MKIVVTGSLGHISRPLTEILISHGHHVIVVSSQETRRQEIDGLGATAAVGSITNPDFLIETLEGADAVYAMVPPPANYRDPAFDAQAYSNEARNSYHEALSKSDVKRIVNLSSWGAHRSEGIGGIAGSYYTEQLLNTLTGKKITHIRPTSFYYNLLSFIPMIKYTGRIALNYGDDDVVSMVAPADIATAVAEELEDAVRLNPVRYVASDELTCNQIASILGNAIGMPKLQWARISDEEAKNNLLNAGLSPAMAQSVADIQAAIRKGLLAEDYIHHKPVFGKVKMADFAQEFASAFNAK